MNIAFILTMPGNNAWNGRWSGEGRCYALVKRITGKRRIEFANAIAGRSFGYNFGDGWFARVMVETVDATRSRQLRKQSRGFCGYDWMVDSILADGQIYGPMQPKPAVESEVKA